MGAVGIWTWFLGKDGSAEDYLDLMYVVLFIGTRALLELLKLPRLKYMPSMDNSNNEEFKNETPEDKEIREELNYRIDKGPMRFDRASASYGTIFKVILTPVWVAFLIIFIAKYGGDVLNIVYFALTPFDELFDGILTRTFLSQVNGIMINTHKKLFKYRSVVNSIFRLALMMNFVMITVQATMVTLMVRRLYTDQL